MNESETQLHDPNDLKHTPEPWTVNKHVLVLGEYKVLIADFDGSDFMSDWKATANAERAVSCVNACRNIPNPEEVVPKLVEALRDAKETINALETKDQWGDSDPIDFETKTLGIINDALASLPDEDGGQG